jgi:hypothetical protein
MSIFQRLVREPLMHFLGLGALVFVLYSAESTVPAGRDETVITVTRDQVERLAAQFETAWRRAPTEAELAFLVESHVREEVYYREALALGLDRDDPVIRRRLHQKMEFLSEGVGLAPEETVLRAYFDKTRAQFTSVPKASFRQLFFDSAKAAEAALAAGIDPDVAGRPSALPSVMEEADERAVDGVFGGGFFSQVASLKTGEWQGPVTSAFGAHLVWLTDLEPAKVPAFDAVRERVEQDWRRAATEELRDAQFQALRARYEVVLPEPSAE